MGSPRPARGGRGVPCRWGGGAGGAGAKPGSAQDTVGGRPVLELRGAVRGGSLDDGAASRGEVAVDPFPDADGAGEVEGVGVECRDAVDDGAAIAGDRFRGVRRPKSFRGIAVAPARAPGRRLFARFGLQQGVCVRVGWSLRSVEPVASWRGAPRLFRGIGRVSAAGGIGDAVDIVSWEWVALFLKTCSFLSTGLCPQPVAAQLGPLEGQLSPDCVPGGNGGRSRLGYGLECSLVIRWGAISAR